MFADKQVEETGFSFSGQVPAPREDRRDRDRFVTILRVGVLIIEGRRELCLIRNISAGGLMAHVYSSVQEGQHVTVELKSNQQIQGEIAWVRDSNAGIAFDAPIDIAGLLSSPAVLDNGWRPRTPRVEIDRFATLHVGNRTYWVQASDISQGGIKIVTDQPPEIGAEVLIELEKFRPLVGTVRWQNGRNCGIAFSVLVPFDELIGWLQRSH